MWPVWTDDQLNWGGDGAVLEDQAEAPVPAHLALLRQPHSQPYTTSKGKASVFRCGASLSPTLIGMVVHHRLAYGIAWLLIGS